MPDSHSKYSPSATDRWLNCPGSIKASEGLPSKSSSYAEEGTHAHSVAEKALLTGKIDAGGDAELEDCIRIYVDTVNFIRNTFAVKLEQIEQKVYHVDLPNYGGTADYFAIYEDDGEMVLHIVDYKHGMGVAVDVYENKQVLSYALIISSNYPGLIDKFRATIVQPRATENDDVQDWEFPLERVQRHEASVREAMQQQHLKAGKHCRWCPVAPRCEELRAELLRTAQHEFDEVISETEVSRYLEILELGPAISSVMNTCHEKLLLAARQGVELPGHKVIERKSHRRWRADTEQTLAELSKAGVEEEQLIERKLITPAKAEKQGVPRELISELAEQVLIGHKVVPETHRGRPVLFGSEFSPINNDE